MNTSSNVDQQELANFNQYAHKWWDTDGEFGALHKINPLRLNFIKRHFAINNKKMLDIGCGGGILSESLALEGAEVTGIDLAEDVLNIAKLHALDSGVKLEYLISSAEDHANQRPEHYDSVTCMEMLEHVPDPQAIVQAAADATKPGGLVFFSTLNRSNKSLLLAVFTAEYLLNIVPKGTHQHDKFIKPSELSQMARQAGLVLIDSAGIDYNPVFKRCALSHDLSINYLMAFQKPQNEVIEP
ncbi:bifunctional 2-polyprenyl-6-hydroxyphenol methylase/3-demethylubiquinol 3-O-methyltransferase UbiG [Thiomicrospira microaerophila]|uniref:bifunctional 2-polyprenyl-6-hydroxyphenol methylase/3-demethylubiquinol 3-O-methyltransferase UbiG n=1 Tax=Thiomicrospira microaerophila TaxID=406020 RepID=UPI00200CA4F4|nr:bifunctional 2-polyprenyl-6-hydroxyphenol methylase/3-demethylubiquinol 3-O-methyltransferase UbiG [Thiomicrospira microaerophila]UQB43098.1 bifunctional 2-polyprenyl-6-hydroxyphenol methylase/3-demethylubiquinol 3-O-methyltransferase UbiG [Thiomicrospira microaerophila]